MDADRTQRYLESLLGRGGGNGAGELLPLISRWNELLASVPGLEKRRPGTHCRISALTRGVLIVEADHPAWMQLLQWHEQLLLMRIVATFPRSQDQGSSVQVGLRRRRCHRAPHCGHARPSKANPGTRRAGQTRLTSGRDGRGRPAREGENKIRSSQTMQISVCSHPVCIRDVAQG